MVPPEDTPIIPLSCKLRLPPGYFELLGASEATGKKGNYWVGWSD